VKISARNFGRDRRYPITNKFREEIGGGAQTSKRAAPPGEAPRTVHPRADGGDMS
jgi:NAD+ synthase